MIGVWGKSPTSSRGEAVAARTNIPILRIEDAFLRSVLTGREGDDSIGLHLDTRGVHFDPAQASDLEIILRKDRLDDPVLLQRAREGIETLRRNHLSKYNAYDPAASCLDADYVVVIDKLKVMHLSQQVVLTVVLLKKCCSTLKPNIHCRKL